MYTCDIRIKCDNKNRQSILYFQCKGAFNEHKRLTSLNLSGTNPAESCTRPPSCKTTQQLTIHNNFMLRNNCLVSFGFRWNKVFN